MPRTVFISCGQFTPEEKLLGAKVSEIVRNCGYEPYFAENQSNLRGLNENILNQLNECVGLIAVMHPRGSVSFESKGKPHHRGSVWVEQEIAIAAFMTQCLGRRIAVATFIHESIRAEGIRELLHLNPTKFVEDSEVLEKLPGIVSGWEVVSAGVAVEATYETIRRSGEQHDYRLVITLHNSGDTRIETYQMDLSFPSILLSLSQTIQPTEIKQRRTETHRLFRITEAFHGGAPLYPDDAKKVFTLDYSIDSEIYHTPGTLDETFTITIRCGNQPPRSSTYQIADFQNF